MGAEEKWESKQGVSAHVQNLPSARRREPLSKARAEVKVLRCCCLGEEQPQEQRAVRWEHLQCSGTAKRPEGQEQNEMGGGLAGEVRRDW